MKFHLKNLTFGHYIKYMRRQSKHVQHLHAIAFAGLITIAIACVLMYTEYGFWHETYRADTLIADETGTTTAEPPNASLPNFFREAAARFHSIGSSSANLLEGKETYTKQP
jgi:hypothetical protein